MSVAFTWRWFSAAPLWVLLACAGCKASVSSPEIEAELTSERTEAPRSEAELPQLSSPGRTQQILFQDARTALQAGDETKALVALQKLADTETLSPLKRDGLLLYASILETRGQIGEALSVLEDLVSKIPPSGDVFLVLARLQQANGQLDEAERSLRDATRSSPELLRAWVALAQLLEGQNQHDAADDAMLHYEREVYRLGGEIERGATLEQRLEAIAQLRIALPDPRVSRILARALKNDAFDVQSAALDALENVGTKNALDSISAYRNNASTAKLRDRADAVLKAIDDREE